MPITLTIGQTVPPADACALLGPPPPPTLEQDFEHACAYDAAGVKVRDVTIVYGIGTQTICNFGTDDPYTGPAYSYIGTCLEPVPTPPPTFVLDYDGVTIAGPARSATGPFTGAPAQFDLAAALAGRRVQSVTVTAFDTQPSLAGQAADQVICFLLTEKMNLSPGETRTWSVARDQDEQLTSALLVVEAFGNSYAHITWTVVQ